jgi:hypothetical protein
VTNGELTQKSTMSVSCSGPVGNNGSSTSFLYASSDLLDLVLWHGVPFRCLVRSCCSFLLLLFVSRIYVLICNEIYNIFDNIKLKVVVKLFFSCTSVKR